MVKKKKEPSETELLRALCEASNIKVTSKMTKFDMRVALSVSHSTFC